MKKQKTSLLKTWLSSLIIASLVCTLPCKSLADDKVIYVGKGTPAPYDGLLFKPDEANKIRVELLEKDTYKALNESLNNSIELYKKKDVYSSEQVSLLMDYNVKLNKEINDVKTESEFKKYLWFGLGIATSILSVYASQKITK